MYTLDGYDVDVSVLLWGGLDVSWQVIGQEQEDFFIKI